MVAGADLMDGRGRRGERWGGPDGPDWRMDVPVAEDGFEARPFDNGQQMAKNLSEFRRGMAAKPPKLRVLDGTREDALDGLQASMQKNIDHWAEQAGIARRECAELRDKVADLRASRLDRLILGFTVGMALTAGAAFLAGLL